MIFQLLTLLFFSLFHCALSNEKENGILFNEFVKVIFDMHDVPQPSEHAVVKKALSVVDAAKILEMVEKNVAEPILASSKIEKREIKEGFTKILSELKAHYPGGRMQKRLLMINAKITRKMEQVQFLMLLLSFSTKLAFTIGSEQLEKHHPNPNNQIAMGSFMRAFKRLQAEFPVKLTWKEYGKACFKGMDDDRLINRQKLRYYLDATFKMEMETMSVSITPVYDDDKYGKRIYNYETIYYYLEIRKQERQESAGQLVKLLEAISNKKPYEIWRLSLSNDEFFFERLLQTWGDHYWLDFPLGIVRFVALKNFGANLAKLMLRKKPKEYFEEKEKQEKNFEKVLKGLIEKFEKDVAEHQKSVDNYNNEQLLHYEDAVQIDWTD